MEQPDPTASPPSYARAPSPESLPSYADALSDAADDLLRPVILVLDGQSIHAEPNPTAPLYLVSRGVASLGPATSVVEFARMERYHHHHQHAAGSAPQRSRHIYNLRRAQPPLRVPSAQLAEYFIQAAAAPARRLGHLGLRKARLAEQWTALPVDMRGWAERDQPPFAAGAAPVLEVRHRQGARRWTDGDGRDVAIEYDSEQGHRLLVTAPLQRATLDALAALWCCRMWEQSADQQRALAAQAARSGPPALGRKKFR